MKLALLGLGAMGSRMARNLLANGHDLAVWNRSPQSAEALADSGARVCHSPRLAAQGAELVITSVRHDEASRGIWLDPHEGALLGLVPGAIAIESSTLSLAWTRILAGEAARKGIDFLDAPVLGSTPQAETASLIHVVGGEQAIFDRARPVLANLGAAAYLMGSGGAGMAMKLVVNALMGIQVAALGELLPQANRWGLDLSRVTDVLAQTAACSPLAKAAAQSMVDAKFSALFPLGLLEKDLGYLADCNPKATPLSTCARAVFQAAVRGGLGELNQTAVIKLYD